MSEIRWDHDQPIVNLLRRWIPVCLPQVRRVGGYVNRPTETGGFSFHSEGRAVDIFLDAHDPEQQRVGDVLFQMFIDHAVELGVDHIIWNRRTWSTDRSRDGVRQWPADRNPHTDHVHVAFTRDGSQQQPPFVIPLLDGIHIELYGSMAGEQGTAASTR